jgi:cupin fold WbuC family metalloprotein
MSISTISLLEPDTDKIWEDTGAKSVSFFCRRRPVRVDAAVIGELKRISAERGGSNVRVCLHHGPDSAHHDMVILENVGKYYRPHRHVAKGETFHIIEGRMGLFAFDADGNVTDACALAAGDIYRVEEGGYHAVMPLSAPVIYHENKPGPFTGQGDSLFPAWAPDGTNAAEVERYVLELKSHLPRS